MNKKISFTRPKKPLPAAADEWVQDAAAKPEAVPDTPQAADTASPPAPAAAAPEPAAKGPRKGTKAPKSARQKPKRKSSSAGSPSPATTTPRPVFGPPARELKWSARMLTSIDRQLEAALGRLNQQVSTRDADSSEDAAREELDATLETMADRIRAIKRVIKSAK